MDGDMKIAQEMSYPSANQVFFIASYNADTEKYVNRFGIGGVINPDQTFCGGYKFGSPLITARVFLINCKKLNILPTREATQGLLNAGEHHPVFDAALEFFKTNDFFRQLVSGQKPNLIFSTQLNDWGTFECLCKALLETGYDKNNIHMIWILPNVKARINGTKDYWDKADMMDHEQILYMSMDYLINRDTDLVGKCFDGDIWVYFDEVSPDSGDDSTGMKNACECLKHSGQPPQTRETIMHIWNRIFKLIPTYYYQSDDGTLK